MVAVPLRKCWGALLRKWDALHVERQGKYSVKRLFTFQHYAKHTSLARAIVILLLTPLPCLTAAVVADRIPLQSPTLGLAHSHTFWLRAVWIVWCISFTILDQYRYFVVQLPLSSPLAAAVSLFISTGSAAIGFGLSCWIDYPLPFCLMLCSPGWFSLFTLSIWII